MAIGYILWQEWTTKIAVASYPSVGAAGLRRLWTHSRIHYWSMVAVERGSRSQTKCWPAKGRLLWNLIEFFHRTKFMTTGLTNFLSTKNWTVSVWVIFQSKTIIAHWQHLIMKRASKLLGTTIHQLLDVRILSWSCSQQDLQCTRLQIQWVRRYRIRQNIRG